MVKKKISNLVGQSFDSQEMKNNFLINLIKILLKLF
jgi:hypothetical protein